MQRLMTLLGNRDRLMGPLSLAIAVLIFSLPFERIPSVNIFNGQVTLRPNQLIALALIGISLGLFWRERRELVRPPRIFLLVFLVMLFVGALISPDLSAGLRVLAATLLTCIAALSLSFTVRAKDLNKYLRALLWCTWIVIAFGMFQYLGDTFGLNHSITGLAPNYVKAVFGFPRIQSTALEPLFLASFLLIPFSLLSVNNLFAKQSHRPTLFAIAVTIVLTVSRGAIVASVAISVALVVLSLVYDKAAWRKALSYIGILVASALFAYLLTFASSLPLGKKVDNKFGGSQKAEQLAQHTLNFDLQDDRVRNRNLAWQAFKTSPVFGIGPGNFDRYAKAAYAPYREAPRVTVNNEPFEILAEMGLVGFVLLGAFFLHLLFNACRFLLKPYRTHGFDETSSVWVLAIIAFLGATAIQYQTFSTLYIMHIWVAIGILMAIVLGHGGIRSEGRSEKN